MLTPCRLARLCLPRTLRQLTSCRTVLSLSKQQIDTNDSLFRSVRPTCGHVARLWQHHQSRALSSHTGKAPSDDDGRILRSPHPSITLPDQHFAEFMFSAMRQYGDKTALVDFVTGRRWTFSQVIADSMRVASGLKRLGLRQGDTLIMISYNCPEYPLVLLGCAACGIVVSPANPSYTAEELRYQILSSESKAVAVASDLTPLLDTVRQTDPEVADRLKNKQIVLGQARGYLPFSTLLKDDGKAFPDNISICSRDDVALLPYSSGTTGLPKGVMLTHFNIMANVMQQQGMLVGEKGEGSTLGVLPLYHIYGLVVSLWSTLYQGNTFVVLPRFQPQTFLSAIQQHKVSVLHLVPPLVLFMAKDSQVPDYDISSVQKVVCGAAPMGEGISMEFAKRSDAILMQVYGMTETSPVTHFNHPPIKLGTIGHVISTTEAKIVDMESGLALGPHQTGELCVRGPQVMKGYMNNPTATASTIIDGWLHSGDLGHYDEEGYFTISDRLKELIKYKGFQVAPAELEALLLTHPEVGDAAVVGVPDEEAGELPRAIVVAKPGLNLDENDVVKFVNSKVAPHKKLRGGIIITDNIPKTASGKIIRRELREKFT